MTTGVAVNAAPLQRTVWVAVAEGHRPQNWHQAGTSQAQKAKKSAGANLLTLAFLGSPTWARTRDLRINSGCFWPRDGFFPSPRLNNINNLAKSPEIVRSQTSPAEGRCAIKCAITRDLRTVPHFEADNRFPRPRGRQVQPSSSQPVYALFRACRRQASWAARR